MSYFLDIYVFGSSRNYIIRYGGLLPKQEFKVPKKFRNNRTRNKSHLIFQKEANSRYTPYISIFKLRELKVCELSKDYCSSEIFFSNFEKGLRPDFQSLMMRNLLKSFPMTVCINWPSFLSSPLASQEIWQNCTLLCIAIIMIKPQILRFKNLLELWK